MPYSADTFSAGEVPTTAKWNKLWTNDAYFDAYIDRAGFPIQIVGNSTSAVSTGTTIIPLDDTIPQNTEGDQYMTQAITPTSATSKLVIEVVVMGAHSVAATDHIVALFQDSTANALAAVANNQATANGRTTTTLKHIMTAGTTSSTTFKIRVGGHQAGTFTFNGHSSTRDFGAITKSSIYITEYRG